MDSSGMAAMRAKRLSALSGGQRISALTGRPTTSALIGSGPSVFSNMACDHLSNRFWSKA
jgi:hypothetical protein